jgi:hypothetical protein
MAHGDTREGKWRGNWRMEWVASTLHTISEHGVSRITDADSHTRLSVVDWTDAPADWNGLVRFAERPNLVYARVPSHFKRSLPAIHPDITWCKERRKKITTAKDTMKIYFNTCTVHPLTLTTVLMFQKFYIIEISTTIIWELPLNLCKTP